MTSDASVLWQAKTFTQLQDIASSLGLDPILARTTIHSLFGNVTRGDVQRAVLYLPEYYVTLRELLPEGDRLFAGPHFKSARRAMIKIIVELLVREHRRKHKPPPKASRPRGMALEKWAKEAGVEEWLDRRAVSLGLPDLHWGNVGPVTLRELMNGIFPDRLLESGWRFLQERAREMDLGLEEEAELAYADRPLPPEPGLARLVERMRIVRKEVREKLRPRPRRSVRVVDARVEDTNPIEFHYQEQSEVRVGRLFIDVIIPLTLEGPPPKPTCSECKTACKHVLSAIDTLFEIAFSQDDDDEARKFLVQNLGKAPWERMLALLDEAIGEIEKDRRETDARVWWSFDERALRIHPYVQSRGRRGQLLKPKRTGVWNVPEAALIEPRDREVLALARAAELPTRERRRFFAQAMKALIGHPRVFSEDVPEEEVTWRIERGHLELALVNASDGSLELRPVLDDRPTTFDALYARFDEAMYDGTFFDFVEDEQILRLIDVPPEHIDLFIGLERKGASIPKEAHPQLIERMARLHRHLPVRFPDELEQQRVPPKNDVILNLMPDGEGIELSARVQPIEGGVLFEPGVGPPVAVASTPGRELVSAMRDFEAEIAAARSMFARLGVDADDTWRARITEVDRIVAVIEQLRSESIDCRWPPGAWRVGSAGKNNLRLRVTAQQDWFGLEGMVELDDRRIDLAVLLDAAREGRRFIRFDDGLFLRLEQEMMERLGRIEPLTFAKKERIEISPAAAELLRDLQSDLEAPIAWRDLEKRIEAAKNVTPEVPRALSAELRSYQIEGHAWMTRLAAWGAGCVLADDMGLGKTIQTLAVLVDRAERGPQLVLAPTSVCFNWIREMERFAPSLRPIAYSGAGRASLLESLKPGDVLIASYALLQRDAEAFAGLKLASLVIDEAQAIKNASTKRARAVRALDADWTVALTGTPVENRLSELWSIFRAVFPGLLGSWEHFRDRFVTPIERSGSQEARTALARVLRPFVLRRTKAQVARELPPRTEITVDVALSPMERALYEDTRLAAVAHLAKVVKDLPAEQVRFHVLGALTRLRQICCHPKLYDPSSTVPSSKLERLLHIVRELVEEGRRALVFSQFTSNLSLVREALDEAGVPYLYLDGQTAASDRGALIDRFQSGEVPLFLLSLKAGGTGLNLTAADTVIHLDPWWNPAVEDQATDRAHRIGQTQPVTVYRLVARGTIEEQILTLHEKKRGLIQELLEGTDGAGALSSDELIRMIQAGIGGATFEREAEDATSDPPEPQREEDPRRQFEALLEAEVAAGRLQKTTAGTYRRVAQRVLQLMEAERADTVERVLSSYDAAIDAGRFPKSDRQFVRPVAQRVLELCTDR